MAYDPNAMFNPPNPGKNVIKNYQNTYNPQPAAANPYGSVGYANDYAKQYGFGGSDPMKQSLNANFNALAPGALYGALKASETTPMYYQGLDALRRSMDPASEQANVHAERLLNLMNTPGATEALLHSLGRQGFGIGAVQGAGLQATNQANQAANQAFAEVSSPEHKAKQLQVLQGLYEAYGSNPAMKALLDQVSAALNKKQVDAATRTPTFWETALGTAGSVLPFFPNALKFKF